MEPAPEHAPDWNSRLASCFGVPAEAARALLSRLRSHLSGQGTLSAHTLNNALATVHAYGPRNIIEADLVIAMVVASHEADRQLVAGQQGGHLPTILQRSRLGQKFVGIQLQALDRLLRVAA